MLNKFGASNFKSLKLKLFKMKVAIVGSRSFNNNELLKQTIEKLDFSVTQIISGGAKGADSLAE